MVKIKCDVCERQMHPRHVGERGQKGKVRYGKNQNYEGYICPFGHTKYVEVKEG